MRDKGVTVDRERAFVFPPATDPGEYLKNMQRTAIAAPVTASRTESATEVIDEAVQILGQLVVDRATNRAFDLLKAKLELSFQCGKTDSMFPSSCSVISPLRLQDLATTTSALEGAILTDTLLLSFKANKLSSTDPEFVQSLRLTLQSGLLPFLKNPKRALSTGAAEIAVQDIISLARQRAQKGAVCTSNKRAEQILVTVGAALTMCRTAELPQAGGPSLPISNCPVMEHVDQFAENCQNLKGNAADIQHARIIAQHLLLALSASEEGAPAVRQRMEHTVDGLFEFVCAVAGEGAGCDSGTSDAGKIVGILRTAAHGALERDTNALIAAASRAVALGTSNLPGAEQGAAHRRRGAPVRRDLLPSER